MPSWFVCDRDEVVIGPANPAYARVSCTKERCTPMVLSISRPVLTRGSRKGWTLGGWFSEPPNTEFEGSTSQATSIYISVLSSSRFDSGFGPIRTLLVARWINHASLCYFVSEVLPALLCNIVNTSYADPPKMHQRWPLNHETHFGAVLLSPGSRASAAT
jgi:hypothetical protein